MNCEKRICAFIDILGFRNRIQNSVDTAGDENLPATKKIFDFLTEARSYTDVDRKTRDRRAKSKQITHFSDSIVMSFRISEPSEVFFTLLDLLHFSMFAIHAGFPIRGGVAYGLLHHSSKSLFGPAMIAAYDAESKAAIFPRIIVPESVVQAGAEAHARHHDHDSELEYILDVLKRDSDGYYYIDYFEAAQHELDDPEYGYPEYLELIRKLVQPHLSSHAPDILGKYGWIKEKFNQTVHSIHRHAEQMKPSDLQAAYESIELI